MHRACLLVVVVAATACGSEPAGTYVGALTIMGEAETPEGTEKVAQTKKDIEVSVTSMGDPGMFLLDVDGCALTTSWDAASRELKIQDGTRCSCSDNPKAWPGLVEGRASLSTQAQLDIVASSTTKEGAKCSWAFSGPIK